MEEQLTDHSASAILKELSDIKASLAVNTNETANIKGSLTEIKIDIKEIKNDYVIRREFNEALIQVRRDLAFFQKLVYSVFSFFGVALGYAILKLILK